MGKQFNTRIQHKIDTYENWNKAENFIPLEGELIIYTTNENGDAETKIKIGDGETLVKDLDFAAGGPASGETSTNAIQSDWAQTNNTRLDYIKNKPGDKIVSEVTCLLTELNIETGGDTLTVPGLYTWEKKFDKQEQDCQEGDKILLTILPDNVKLESALYTDEVTDNAFNTDNSDTGHYATFNLTFNNVLDAYVNGFIKKDENIPYGLGINIIKTEKDNSFSVYVVSAENNLENKIIILEVVRNNENYIKLSNNALNIDLEPTENSDSLITSGAVYNALSASGNLIPEIYNLDDAIETGEYWYIQDELGIKNKVSVIKSVIEADGMSGFYVSQTIFPGASEGGKIYSRLGYQIDNDSFKWLQDNLIETITSNDIKNSVGKSGHVLTSDTGGYWSWNKPKYVPTPKTEDIGKILTAIGTDPYEGFKWEELDKTMELPVIQDVSGFTELDKIIEDGVYKYITDNRINCILIVSSYDGTITIGNQVIGGKIVTQLLIKTIGSFTGVENIGRGLIGPGVFIRIGVGNDQYGELAFEWQNSGRFENIHDLPQAPANEGCYILNSKRDEENNELRYNWTEFNDTDLTDGIINQISTWVDGELANVAHTNITNTFTTDQTINGDLTVNGDIIQEGDNYVTHAEHVYTEDDYIILRDGAQTPLSSYAGFEIQNYDGNNTTGHLVFDNQGTARVGDIGEEEPLTTRAEANEIINGSIATWGIKNGAPVLTSGLSIMILTQTEYDSIVKDNNTLYLIKEG